MTAFKIEPIAENLSPELPDDLGFGRYFTNRMFLQRYTRENGWGDATIGAHRNLSLSPAAEAFQCGQMVFDGTKAYRRPDGDLNLFRVRKNVERFNRSAERMGMPIVDEDFHIEVISTLVGLEHRWVPADPDAWLDFDPEDRALVAELVRFAASSAPPACELLIASAEAANPAKPLRMSVTPPASQIFVDAGTGITSPGSAPIARRHPDRQRQSAGCGARSPGRSRCILLRTAPALGAAPVLR